MLPAVAYFTSTGAGAETAQTGTLDPPTAVTVPTSSSSTVTVKWTAPLTLPAPTGYTVTRVGSGTAAACGSSPAAPIAGTSCVDSAIPDGTYTYVVTSIYRSWTAASAPSTSVLVAKPVALAVTGQPTTTIAGEFVSPAITVALRTSGGTAAPTAGVPITLAFGANPAGGVLAGTLTVATNAAGVATFGDVSITKAGAGYSLTATAAGLTSATSATFTVTAAPAYKFVFTTAPVTGIASSTAVRGPMTIQSRDVFDNPTLAPAGGTVVSLSSTSAGTKVFAATAGGTSITTVTIPAGSSTVSFYYGDTLAGNPIVSAGRTGFSTAHQTETITAAAPAKFAFTSAPITGSASTVPTLGPLTVQLTDTFGNTAVATASITATMSSSSTGTKRFSLSSTGTPTTTSLVFGVGASTASFYYGDTKAGTPTITVSRSGYTSATQAQTILSTVATKLAITSAAILLAPPSTTASRGPFTVQQQDATGNPVLATAGGVTVTLSSSSTSTTKVFAATLSGTATTTVTIPAGASTTTFYYGDTKAGSATISVSRSGLTTGTQSTTTAAGPISQLAITSTAISGAASATAARGPVTVQSRDQYGNAAVAPAGGVAVALSSSSTGVTVFSATASGTPTTSVTIAAAASTVSFYYGDTKAGTATITAGSPGLTSATQNATITGATPAALAFSTAPVSGAAAATAARGPFTAQLRDAFGNVAVAPSGGTVVTPASSSSGTKVFAATASGTPVTTRTIAAAASSTSFYYGDTKAGTPTITLTAPGLTSASQLTTVTPAAPTVLAITSAALSGPASAAASLGPLTVELRDPFGNVSVAPAAGSTISLASTSTGTKIFAATQGGAAITSVTIPAGASSASVFYGDSKTGNPTITVSGTGLTSATQAATVTAAVGTRFAITSTALSGSASATASMGPATVELRDAFGNPSVAPAAGVVVSLSSTSTGSTVFSASPGGPATAGVTIAAGASTAVFYYGDTRAGAPTITAAGTGIAGAAQAQTVVAAAPGQLVLTSAAISGTVSSAATLGPVTVQLQDAFGNIAKAPAGGTSVSLSSSTTGSKIFAATLSGASVGTVTVPAGSSTVNFYYGDTKAGSPILGVSGTGLTGASQPATITAAAATKLAIPGAAVTGAASTTATIGPITVQVTDTFGNPSTAPAGGTTVTLASSSTGTKIFAGTAGGASTGTVLIPAGGTSVPFFYGDTKAGTPTITVSATGFTGATQVETVTGATPAQLIITSAALAGPASSTATLGPLTIALRDAFANPTTAPAGGTAVSLTSSSTGSTAFSPTPSGPAGAAMTIPAGSGGVSVYYGDTKVGTPTLGVAGSGLTGATQTATVTAGPVAQLAITSAPVAGPASATAALGPAVVQTRDEFGNLAIAPAGGTAISLSSSTTGSAIFAAALNGTSTTTVTVPTGASTATFYYGDTRSGAPTITAARAGVTSATQTATVTAAAAGGFAISSPAVSGTASTTASTGPITIQITDAFGNPTVAPAGGTVATLGSSSAGTKFFSLSLNGAATTTATIPAGAGTVSVYYADTLAGTPTISVSRSGFVTGTQTATVTAAAPSKLVFGQQPTSTIRGSTITPAVTVQILDQFNNLTTSGQPVTIAIATNPVSGVLHGTTTVAAAGGVATFSGLSITAILPGIGYTLQASATGSASATSVAFTVL